MISKSLAIINFFNTKDTFKKANNDSIFNEKNLNMDKKKNENCFRFCWDSIVRTWKKNLRILSLN